MNRSVLWATGVALFLLVCLGAGLLLGAWVAPVPAVGVVRFEQVIDDATAGSLIEMLEAARDDPAIAAVVVEVNSPGGYATSSENLFHSLLDLRAVKPVVVFVDGLAASGGYYMAAAANRIYAAASSYVGNVGTRGGRPTDPFLYPEELSSGPYKLSGGSRFDQIRQLDLVAQSFITNVVTQRQSAPNPLTADAATVAEARIYLGSEAQAIGYIDAEGGRSDAIAGAAELAGLRRWRTVDLIPYFGFEIASAVPAIPLAQQAQALARTAPADTIFMLDDRIPLPEATGSRVLEHLRALRAAAPYPLNQSAAPFGSAPYANAPAYLQPESKP